MLQRGMRKQEIEEELVGKGDFVQIDHLTRFLELDIPLDIKKFCYIKLIQIYEKKGMFNDVGKMYVNLAISSIAYTEKIRNYVLATEFYVRAGLFDHAEQTKMKALGNANIIQKEDIVIGVKNFYKRLAVTYEEEMKRSHAASIYERLLEMNLPEVEKEEVKAKLLEIYKKLGKFKESRRLDAMH